MKITTADWLRSHPRVLFPPSSGEVALDILKHPLISLCGPSENLLAHSTWHRSFITYMVTNGYDGYFYVPERITADIHDYNDEQNRLESENNRLVFGFSQVLVYWQPKSAKEVHLQMYSLALIQLTRQQLSLSESPKVFIGMEDTSLLAGLTSGVTDNERFQVYSDLTTICSKILLLPEFS